MAQRASGSPFQISAKVRKKHQRYEQYSWISRTVPKHSSKVWDPSVCNSDSKTCLTATVSAKQKLLTTGSDTISFQIITPHSELHGSVMLPENKIALGILNRFHRRAETGSQFKDRNWSGALTRPGGQQ